MRRTISAVTIAIAAASCMLAGVAAAFGDGAKWERSILIEGVRPTDRFALVLDVSGSMEGESIAVAKGEIGAIVMGVSDRAWVKAYAVNTTVEPWREGWTLLPDGEAIDDLSRWLSGFSGAGGTDLDVGVRKALEDESDDLSVLLFSDCDLTQTCADAQAQKIREVNDAREPGPAIIHAVCIRAKEKLDAAGRSFLAGAVKPSGGSAVLYTKVGGDDPPFFHGRKSW